MKGYEARQPDPSGGFRIAWGYSDQRGTGYFVIILKNNGWADEIDLVPMTKHLKKKYGWNKGNDPRGPWMATEGYVTEL